MSPPSVLVGRRTEFVLFFSSPTYPFTQLQPAVAPQLQVVELLNITGG